DFGETVDLYVFIDNRVVNVDTTLPWVSAMGFVDTMDDLGIDEGGDGDIDQMMSIYKKAGHSGSITLGPNNNGNNMYGIAATFAPSLTVGSKAGELNLAGTINSAGALTFPGPGNTLVSGMIVEGTPPTNLVKTGAGTLTLATDN